MLNLSHLTTAASSRTAPAPQPPHPSPPTTPQRQALLQQLAVREHARYHILSQVEAVEPGWDTGWIHREIGQILDTFIIGVERKLSPRLIICLPPRAGKTLTVGRHLPIQVLGRHPEWELAYATYNDDRAADVGRKVRALIENPVIQDIHPRLQVDSRVMAATNIGMEAGGGFYAVGRGGALTGRGFHIGVVDDILKDREEAESKVVKDSAWDWYTSVMRTRVHPGAGIIVMSTRWAVDDIAGRLLDLAKADPNADQWMVYSFPALAEHDEAHRKKGESFHEFRFSAKELSKTRASLPPRDWQSLYQQNPFVPEGNHFRADWFQFYTPAQRPTNLRNYVTTDFAASQGSGDNSVSWAFGLDDADNIWFYPDPFCEQCEIAAHDEATWDLIEKYDAPAIFVEKGVLWKAHAGGFRQESLLRRRYPRYIEVNRSKAKLESAGALMRHMQKRKVFWPDTPFVRNIVIPQFLRFTGEKGGQDDIVDTCSLPFLAFKEMQRPIAYEIEDDTPDMDPTTRWVLDRMGDDTPRVKHPFSAGDRDGSVESDGDEYDTDEESSRCNT